MGIAITSLKDPLRHDWPTSAWATHRPQAWRCAPEGFPPSLLKTLTFPQFPSCSVTLPAFFAHFPTALKVKIPKFRCRAPFLQRPALFKTQESKESFSPPP